MNHSSNLSAKVAARNSVNARMREKAQAFFAAARPFVGKKVKTVNGDFTQAFRDALAPLTGERNGDFWLSSSYSLARVFKACENGPRSSHYAEATLYIGEIDGQTLASVHYAETFNAENYRTDYTPEAIAQAREEVKAARAVLQRAESALAGFGEHDNS